MAGPSWPSVLTQSRALHPQTRAQCSPREELRRVASPARRDRTHPTPEHTGGSSCLPSSTAGPGQGRSENSYVTATQKASTLPTRGLLSPRQNSPQNTTAEQRTRTRKVLIDLPILSLLFLLFLLFLTIACPPRLPPAPALSFPRLGRDHEGT